MKKKQRPYILIDGPSPFDCLETWVRFWPKCKRCLISSPSKSKSGALESGFHLIWVTTRIQHVESSWRTARVQMF